MGLRAECGWHLKEFWRDHMKSANLTQLVCNLCSGQYSQAELIQFINLAQKISLSYLKYQEMLGKRISGNTPEADLELSDLALDCIAELFASNDQRNFPQLKKYYEAKFAHMPSIDDTEVLILTRRLIVRKTKQELSRIFRERDPEGAKIVRNIKVAVRTSHDLYLFREMGKEFIFYNTQSRPITSFKTEKMNIRLRHSLPPIPEEILYKQFVDIYNLGDSVSVTIRNLLISISALKQFQNYLSLEMIVKLIRHIKFDACKEWLTTSERVPTPSDHLETKEMENYIDTVMKSMWNRLDLQYLRTKKLPSNKALIYHQALRDVLYDLIQKRDTSSYYRNLKFYISNLSQKEYRQQERSIFEYLAKLAKKEFRKYLCEML